MSAAMRERLLASRFPLLDELLYAEPIVVLDTGVLTATAEGIIDRLRNVRDYIRNRAGRLVTLYTGNPVIDYMLGKEGGEDKAAQILAYCMLHPGKCIIPEPVIVEAARLSRQVPELSVIVRLARQGKPEDIARILRFTVAQPDPEEAALADAIKAKYPELSKTDAAVLAMAKKRSAVLATGDRALARAARDEGVPYVYLYSSYPSVRWPHAKSKLKI